MSADVMPPVHNARSPRWHGNPRQYQLEAQARWAKHHDRGVLPWSYVTTSCDLHQCLTPDCMTMHAGAAKRIAYPANVCVYCGEPGWTRDHLLPEPLTGAAVRSLVVVVPACGSCNSYIGDTHTPNVGERRRVAQLRIERKNRHLLLSVHKDAAYLAEVGPALRSVAEKNNLKRDRVKARLGWPVDPFYDVRAFQKAGIEDPASLGLCDEEATPLRAEYREYA